jgi:hypothetical protein
MCSLLYPVPVRTHTHIGYLSGPALSLFQILALVREREVHRQLPLG